jgi:hypothetical protein
MSLSDKKEKYTLTDGNGTSIDIDSFGVTYRQIETIEKTLDALVSKPAPNSLTFVVGKSKSCARQERVVAMAMLAMQYAMEHNRPKTETSQNSIKREIRTLRASGKFSERTMAQEFLVADAGGHRKKHHKKNRSDKIRVVSPDAAANDAGAPAPEAPRSGGGKRKAEDRNFPLSQMLEDGSIVINSEKTLTPTPGQTLFLGAYDNSEAIIIDGPAGSGKTEFAIYMALRDLKLGHIDRIILSASVQKDEEEIGYLPGELEEKMRLMISQMQEKIDKHLGAGNLEEGRKVRERLEAKGLIQIKGLGDMGGESFERTVLILDEAHQAAEKRLNIVIGRVENPMQEEGAPPVRKNAKVIFCGHSHQNTTEDGSSAYGEFCKKFSHPEYQGIVTCLKYNAEDVRRSKLLEIMARLGHDISKAEIQKAIRDLYSPDKIDEILTGYFNKAANNEIKDAGLAKKLELYVNKLVGQMDTVDLAILIERNLEGPNIS